MLKFKEMKNSIIRTNKQGQAMHHDQPRTSFKLTPRKSELGWMGRSPLSRRDSNRVEPYLYETSRKENVLYVDYVQSENKLNSQRYYQQGQTITFGNIQDKPLVFGHPRRKGGMQHQPSNGNIYTDNQQNTPKKSNLSFASLLSSKKSAQKGYGTERKQQRESSISKLKDKLFGMKRVISDKSNYVCVTPTKAKEEAQPKRQRVPVQNPFTPLTHEQQVCMSIDESSPSELDMSPF